VPFFAHHISNNNLTDTCKLEKGLDKNELVQQKFFLEIYVQEEARNKELEP